MPIELDNRRHCDDFVRLNLQWINEYFEMEEADRKMAADPFRIVADGAHPDYARCNIVMERRWSEER